MVKDLIVDRCQITGEVKSSEFTNVITTKVFMIQSTASTIVRQIMNDAIAKGHVTFVCNGRWYIDKPMDYLYDDIAVPVIKINTTFYDFLYPKKNRPEVQVYEQIKDIKDKKKFAEAAIKLCAEAGISLKTLIDYIYEKKKWNKSDNPEADPD